MAKVVALLGLRQSGKTTLARRFADRGDLLLGRTQPGRTGLAPFRGGKRLGFEVKYTDTPKVTPSQRAALEHLKLDSLTIVCPGDADYPLDERIQVTGLSRIGAHLDARS